LSSITLESKEMNRLRVNNLSLKKGNEIILQKISLELTSGQSYLLYGKNGAGKTSLLRCLVGLETSSHGEVSLNPSVNITEITSFLPSTNKLPNSLNVGNYIRSFNDLFDSTGQFDKALFEKVYEMFQIKSFEDKKFGELSKGMAKMVFITISLMKKSDFIVLDEPFEALDITMKIALLQLLLAEVANGKMLLVSSHEIAETYKHFDHLIGIKKGLIASILQRDNITDYQELINQIR